MQTTQIIIYDGFDELDAVAPYEVLAASGLAVELATLGPQREIRSAHGMSIMPHATLAAAPGILIVPGGGWVSRSSCGAWAEVQHGALPIAIAERHAAGTTLAGVCSGVMLLASAGILGDRPCVTHHAAMRELRESGADVRPDARVVDDGDIVTAGGVTSALDLALHIVERELGAPAAAAGARRIEYDRRGPILRTAQPDRGSDAQPTSKSPA
jgi:transcriptional regulator GlxA family with amidase domain